MASDIFICGHLVGIRALFLVVSTMNGEGVVRPVTRLRNATLEAPHEVSEDCWLPDDGIMMAAVGGCGQMRWWWTPNHLTK